MRESMVTIESVSKSVSELDAEKKPITTRAVRDKLGGGSLKKISDLMKECRSETVLSETSIAMFNEDIQECSSKLTRHMEELVQKTIVKSSQRKSNLLEDHEEALNEIGILEKRLQDSQTLNEDKDETIRRQQAEITVLKESLKNAHEEKEKHRDQYQAKLEDLTREAAYFKGQFELLSKQAGDEEKSELIGEAKVKPKAKK
jgi:chromosome segregation ATPase